MHSWFAMLNLGEAVLWCVVGGVIAWRYRRWGLAGVFVVFGMSDVVEARTGAWYRPWWLLVWNAVCILGILGLLWHSRPRRDVEAEG